MGSFRFAPGEFKYNGRIAVALCPSLLVLAGFGGKIPVGVTLVGTMLAYILDAMRFREGAIFAIWITLGSANLSLWLSEAIFLSRRSLLMSFLIAVCCGITLLATGVWATLQFKWVQMQYPVTVLAFEKLALATAFTIAAMVQSWGLIAAVGASQAPFYIMPLLCGLYHLLALPLVTSFHVRGKQESAIGGKQNLELMIQEPVEGGCAATLLVVLPAALYTITHWSMMGQALHVWSALLLLSTPILYLSVLREGLWWLPGSVTSKNTIRQVLCLGSLAVALAALEGRLIFPAFGQYIQLHPPWNYVAVTFALYGFAALAIIYFSGMIDAALDGNAVGATLLVSSVLGSLAAGIPVPVMAAPVTAAYGLALFLSSRDFRDYLLFVLGTAGTIAWFLYHHFWFLEIDFQGYSLQTVCSLLWLALLPALLLPGLYIAKASAFTTSVLMLTQAGLLTFLEEHLYMGVDEVEGMIYPAAMVIATSGLGLLITHRLSSQESLDVVTAWILYSTFLAKLSMLLLPHAKLPVPCFFLVLAVTAPTLLNPGPKTALNRTRPPAWHGALYILGVVLATLYARYGIYELLHWTLGQRPSEGLLWGAVILVAAGGCLPLLTGLYKTWRKARRVLVLSLAAGALLVLLRPPLPLEGGSRCPDWVPAALCFQLWDTAHRPEHDDDDKAIWGEYGEQRGEWRLWMLTGAIMSLLSSLTDPQPGSKSASRVLAYSAVSGLSIGAYLASEFFPGQTMLQGVIAVGTLAVVAVLFGLRMHGTVSPKLLALLLGLWGLGLPLAVTLQSILPLPRLPSGAVRLYADSAILIEKQRQQANRAALLAVYSAQAFLLAFAAKLRISAAGSSVDILRADSNSAAGQILKMGNLYAEQAASFLGQCLPSGTSQLRVRSSRVKGHMNGILYQLESEGYGWLPSAANFVTLSCFFMSLTLSNMLEQDSDLSIFALAPILLLLTQDSILWPLTSSRRYFPVSVAISGFLLLSSLAQAWSLWTAPASIVIRPAGNAVSFVKNLWLIGATLPSHFLFSEYLWARTAVKGLTLLIIGPLSILAALFTDLMVVRILAGTGILMSIAQSFAISKARAEGLRLI